MVQREESSTPDGPGSLFAERFVDADGFRIRYLEAGRGAVLIHLRDDGLRFSRADELLSRSLRVIAFDLRGLREAAGSRSTPYPNQLAGTVARALSHLGIHAYNVLGSSLGAEVALRLALRERSNVTCAVLEETDVFERSETEEGDAVEEQAKDGRAELDDEMRSLQTPVLLLAGTRDGPVRADRSRRYAALLPNANLVYVYDAGQAIGDDRPEAFVEVVSDFLERHEGFIVSRRGTLILP